MYDVLKKKSVKQKKQIIMLKCIKDFARWKYSKNVVFQEKFVKLVTLYRKHQQKSTNKKRVVYQEKNLFNVNIEIVRTLYGQWNRCCHNYQYRMICNMYRV